MKVDRKAAILLSFQGGAFALAVTQNATRVAIRHWPTLVALAILVIAMCVNIMVILPILGSLDDLAEARSINLIFFGHLRRWNTDDLARKFSEVSTENEMSMLSTQLVALSRINWRKHRLVQLSVALTIIAVSVGSIAVATAQI